MAGERIHEQQAALYDRIYAWLDYAAEARRVHELLAAEGVADGARVVEGACGTGSHLAHLKAWYRVEGFDLAEGMLAVARSKLPDVRLWRADLETFALEQPTEVFLCLFSSIGYVGPLPALERASQRIAAALAPGGVALIQPWFTPETFHPGHAHLTTYQGDDVKLARASVSRVEGRRSILDFHWLVARPDAPAVEQFVDRHVLWLYTPEEMVGSLTAAGLEAEHRPASHGHPLGDRGLLLARKPRG